MSAVVRFTNSGGLWNLWDMLKINASSFYRVLLDIHRAQLLIEERNKDKDSYSIPIVDDKLLSHFRKRAESMLAHAKELGVPVTIKFIEQHIWHLNSSLKPSMAEAVEYYNHITKTLEFELSTIGMFVVEPNRREYYQPSSPLFDAEFEKKFYANGAFEVDEAAKCIAFGRSTAAVFHLMRAMEVGVRAVARCLQIPDPLKPAERNWGYILGEVRKGIEAKWVLVAQDHW